MRKRIIALLMAAITAVSPIVSYPTRVEAKVVAYSSYYDDYVRALDSRCVEFQRYLDSSTGEKQYGLLFQLRIFVGYMLYNHFMIKYDGGVNEDGEPTGFGENCATNPEIYEQDLSERLTLFNEMFDKKSVDFKKCKLNNDFDGYNHSNEEKSASQKAKAAYEDNLMNVIPAYCKEILADIQSEISAANGNQAEIKRIKKENTTLISNVYEIYASMFSAKTDLASYTPFTEEGKHVKYTIKSGNKTIEEVYAGIFEDYKDLLEIAQDARVSEEIEEDISVDLTKQYVENLSDAVMLSGNVEIPESPKLTLLYYAIMAASAVYVPLQSYAGCTEFQSALKSLTNDDQVQAEIVEFYSAVKDMRKPLYKRALDDEGAPTGTASIVTIQDFLDDIKNGNSGSLCTVLGDFKYDSNSASWLYVQNEFRTSAGPNYDSISDNSQSSVSVSDSDEELGVDDGRDPTVNLTPNGVLSQSDVITVPHVSGSIDASQDGDATIKSAPVVGDGAEETASLFDIFDFTMTAEASEVTTTTETPTPNSGETSTTTTESAEDTDTIEDTAVFAYSEITDDTKLSEPLYLYGVDYFRDVDNLTAVVMYNALASSANLNYISDKSTRYLYVNPFGDIVTDDNLIIFPGIANPAIYQDVENYNIYTAAFMNSYPNCYKSNSQVRLTNKADIGKYLIVKQSKNTPNAEKGFYAVKTESIDSIKVTEPVKSKKLFLDFSVDGSKKYKLMQYKRLIFGSSSHWNESNEAYTYTPLISNVTATAGGSIIFPYVPNDDVTKKSAQSIAQNMYWYLVYDIKTGKFGEATRFNENFILHYFILNGLGGTNNPKGYSQNTLEQYERYVKNAPERFLSTLKGLSQNISEFTAKVQGVIGLRESMQSPILGTVLVVCRANLLYFFLFTTIILLYIFARMKLNLMQIIVKWFISLMVAYLCVTLVPTYLPMVFNVAINNISENLTYKILALQVEGEAVDILEEELDENGRAKFNSESLTLYKAGVLNYETFMDDVNADEEELVGGNIEIINQNAGLFVEGDSIKINTSRLFKTLRIAKHDGEMTPYYRIKAFKTVSNNVDYYMPFYQFTDKFVKELNQMNKIYQIPKSVIVYSNGVMKDNFMVHSFVNSPIFLSPGNYEQVVYTEGLELEEAANLKASSAELAETIEKVFGDEEKCSDFLRMSEWIFTPSEAMKKTLWYQTMVKNGFYSKSGVADEEKIGKLITHVNYQTRRFIYEMDDQIGRLSDETMIKMIALRATIDFNQQISDFGSWVYPFSLNYGDFTLKDVVSTVFTSDYNKYISMNFSVVDYIGDSKGWFNLIVLDVLIVLMFLIVYVVQLLIPVMYIFLCLTVILKLLAQSDAKVPVKGFAKCLSLIMGGYTVFAIALAIAEKMDGNVIAIYVMLAVCLLLVYTLFVVISSLIFNFADMGNSVISAKLASAFPQFKSTMRSLSANRLVMRKPDTKRILHRREDRVNDRYRHDASVDEMYDRSYVYNQGYDTYDRGRPEPEEDIYDHGRPEPEEDVYSSDEIQDSLIDEESVVEESPVVSDEL